jgi:hypothetical protein
MAALAGFPPKGFFLTTSDSSMKEIEEYEKILRIRDQVFAGSHPRLTVPAHALRKVSPRLPQVLPVPIQSRIEFVPPAIDHSSAKLPGLQTNNHIAEQTTTNSIAILNGAKPVPQLQTPQPTASGIDPIFLTKSDELVRQETVFQRSRLEKQLREQFEKKKSDARTRPHPEEVKPEINISTMLTQVLEAVKPLSTTKPSDADDRASPSESFDENSLYSSRAPDSTPEEGALSENSPPTKHQVQPRVLDNLDADDLVDQRMLHGKRVEKRDSPRQANFRPTRTIHSSIPFPYDLRQDRGMLLGVDTVDLTSMDVDDDDEPEYSPPEATEQHPPQNNEQASRFDYRDPRSRPLRRYSGADQHDKRPGSPLEADMRIVRNHITSPLAPQPSRVSPLAVAKAPPFSQNTRPQSGRNHQNGGQTDPSRQSPDYAHVPENSRKKRKLDKKANRVKKRKSNMLGSPEAHIKDEPVSPPPFHDVQPLGASKPRAASNNVPIYIDDEPMQQMRYMPGEDRFAQPLPRQIIYEEPPLPRSDPRPYSRASVRPSQREEQDLRRVASLHNMRAEAPLEYVDVAYNTPTRARAPTYAMVESPHSAPLRSNREPTYMDERPAARQDRAVGSPAPGYRIDPHLEVRYRAPEMLPPEQRRLVQDQYGNQFYEVISRQSITPRQPIDVDSYNENTHARTDRAGSVFIEPSRDKRYVQDMPPPQVSYRRIGEAGRTPVIDSRQMEQMADPSRVQRSASVQVVDYAPRQPTYADDRVASRAPVRMGSVRPQEPRYEEVRVPVSRVQSVRPVGREGSVFLDDRPQVRREFVPVQAEQPMYRRVMQNGQQYYEVQEARYER